MWTCTSVPLTIIPALSPPHVPTTSVIGVDVAAEHASSAKIDGSTEIRVMPERYGAAPLRSSLNLHPLAPEPKRSLVNEYDPRPDRFPRILCNHFRLARSAALLGPS